MALCCSEQWNTFHIELKVEQLTLLLRIREVRGSYLDDGDRPLSRRFFVIFVSASSKMGGKGEQKSPPSQKGRGNSACPGQYWNLTGLTCSAVILMLQVMAMVCFRRPSAAETVQRW
jgi:hypothetical protein